LSGLGHRVVHEPHGRGLQVVETLLQALGVKREFIVAAVLLAGKSPTSLKNAITARPPLAQLAAHEIKRLNAVGAFVDHGDAGIAHELAPCPIRSM
jgi:hypothetical protein